MKNLFKNLMLVAVAAMAFTSCSQDVNELNKLEKKTTFEFVASFDGDTRSGFTGSSEDENGKVVYHSEWFGGETVMLVAGDQVKSATVDDEGKFTATFDGEISQIDIYTPMESFYKPYMDYNFYQVNPEVLAEQTPLANSVDPKAHVAKGYVLVDGEGNQIIPVTLAHEVAYGKMTVNTPAEFVIDHVEIALNGVFDGSTRNLSYTINADNVENNVFWFATEPITVSDFTVTAYDAEGNAVTKTVDVAEAGKTMSFQYGRVGTFSVSGLEEAVVVEKFDSTYAYVYQDYGPTDKEIMFVAEDGRGLRIDFYNVYDSNCIVPGTYTFTGDSKMYPNWSYYYANVYEGYTSKLDGGQAVVSVEDGQYKIVFTNMALGGTVYVESFTFKGAIEGMKIYDARTPLATPEVTYELNGKTLTVSWNAVDGAVGYYVRDYYYEVDTTTTETTLTVELSEYKWYYIYVSAIAAADNANFKNSAEAEISFELKDPRTVLSAPTNVRATIDGRYATIEWDAVEGADYYALSYYLNGNHEVSVEGTSHTIDVGFDVSDLYVYVFAKANDDNPNYLSSTSWNAYAVVNTGSDPSIVPIAFTTCELNEYIPAQWRVSYNFSDGANNSMTLWLTTDHGANDASLGGTQTYNQFYSTPGSVGNYYRFCPVNVVINGESKTVTGGNVQIESLGTSWNVKMKLTIDDGSTQIFIYSGGVGVDNGGNDSGDDSGEFTPDYTITNFSYNRLSTSYYSHQWSVSTSNGLSFSIYTPNSQGNELHEGTYNYYSGNGNTNGDFTFSTRLFSPAPSSGTMVVSKDGDTYTINLTVVVGGTTQKYQYVGTL